MSEHSIYLALLDPDRPVPDCLTGPGGSPVARRFDIYRNNVAASLIEALARTFPVVQKLVGKEFFTAMARAFIGRYPPRSPVLMAYGMKMPGFLAEFPPVAHLSYLCDIARLELALVASYHAEDARALSAELLATIDPQVLARSKLRLSPSLRLVRSPWPVFSIWHSTVHGSPPPERIAYQDVMILRPDFDPVPFLLPPNAADFILALQEGKSVHDAVLTVTEFDLDTTLGILLAGQAIVDICSDHPPSW